MADYIDDDNLWKEDLFATLGISHDASDSEIKKTYLKLAKKYHPDKFMENNEEKVEAQKLFSKITVAYNVLSDPGKRNHYLDLRRLLASHLPENQTQVPSTSAKSETKQETTSATPSSSQPSSPPQQKNETPKPDETAVTGKVKEEQARSFYNMGMDYMKKNNLDKAIDSFKQAISIQSGIAEFHSQLGLAYKNKNWVGMAQSEFKLALKLNPGDRLAKTNFTSGAGDKKAEPPKKGLFGGLFNFGKKK